MRDKFKHKDIDKGANIYSQRCNKVYAKKCIYTKIKNKNMYSKNIDTCRHSDTN